VPVVIADVAGYDECMITGIPEPNEAADYYFAYIDRITSPDIVAALESQLEETAPFWLAISDERSLHRYAPEKWSIRQVLNHVTDCERLFLFRAFWFARGFAEPLPSFDQEVASRAAAADAIPWHRHVEEFRRARLSSLDFFQNLPPEAWMRTGIASGNSFTVRAVAFILAGHVEHHNAILRERYL
jgi:hypothetical protein